MRSNRRRHGRQATMRPDKIKFYKYKYLHCSTTGLQRVAEPPSSSRWSPPRP